MPSGTIVYMDHDRLFKALLTTFFVEFLDLFLPEMGRYFDRKSIQFLDKEIFTDIGSSERHEVDLVAKAKFRGKEAFFLIHVENQATAQDSFPERMFRYFSRLHEKYRLPVYPIVLFSHDSPRKPVADRYELAFPNWRVLDFRYRAIQLNRLNWRDFLKRPNPVASALMVKMRIEPVDRPWVKLECLRMMVKLKLDKARSQLIGKFMTDYLKLTSAETVVYNTVMATISPKEKEEVLDLSNEWSEAGARGIVLTLLNQRFTRVPATLKRQIGRLSERSLNEFAQALFDFESTDDAQAWIAARPKSS